MAIWNATFELSPKAIDTPTQGDDEIRLERGAISERAENEHTTYLSTPSTTGDPYQDWRHKAGSAAAFYQSAAPTTRIGSGAVPLVDGMLWVDSDTGYLFVRHASAWVGVMRELARVSIQGTLATGTTVVPAIVFPQACTIVKVSARVLTAPTGASLLVDLNKNGAGGQSIFTGATRITIAAAAYADSRTSFDAGYKVLAADDYLTLDIDQVGSTIAGADLSISVEVLL